MPTFACPVPPANQLGLHGVLRLWEREKNGTVIISSIPGIILQASLMPSLLVTGFSKPAVSKLENTAAPKSLACTTSAYCSMWEC